MEPWSPLFRFSLKKKKGPQELVWSLNKTPDKQNQNQARGRNPVPVWTISDIQEAQAVSLCTSTTQDWTGGGGGEAANSICLSMQPVGLGGGPAPST